MLLLKAWSLRAWTEGTWAMSRHPYPHLRWTRRATMNFQCPQSSWTFQILPLSGVHRIFVHSESSLFKVLGGPGTLRSSPCPHWGNCPVPLGTWKWLPRAVCASTASPLLWSEKPARDANLAPAHPQPYSPSPGFTYYLNNFLTALWIDTKFYRRLKDI
jgi:hypothetical protein